MKFPEICPEESHPQLPVFLGQSGQRRKGDFCSLAGPKSAGNERNGRLAQAAKWKKRGPFSQFSLLGKFPFCTRSSKAQNSWAVVSLNQCWGLTWDALWSMADQTKYEQGVIFEQLMSLPEQIAWKQPQWLALILKPSLVQINSLQLEGRRKLLIYTHLFIFRQKIKQLGTVMICPWCGSCKHLSTCKTCLHRLNLKWTWDCGNFPTEYTYSMKESYGQADCCFHREFTENDHFDENKRLYFHSKIPVDFVCFYKTLNNSMEVKHCDLAKIGDMLKQIFAIGCSDVIRAKSLRLSISLEISTFHVLLGKKKKIIRRL